MRVNLLNLYVLSSKSLSSKTIRWQPSTAKTRPCSGSQWRLRLLRVDYGADGLEGKLWLLKVQSHQKRVATTQQNIRKATTSNFVNAIRLRYCKWSFLHRRRQNYLRSPKQHLVLQHPQTILKRSRNWRKHSTLDIQVVLVQQAGRRPTQSLHLRRRELRRTHKWSLSHRLLK